MEHIDEPTLLSALKRQMKMPEFMFTALLDNSVPARLPDLATR
jgi:hypothetical protein